MIVYIIGNLLSHNVYEEAVLLVDCPSYFQRSVDLYDPQQVQSNEYDGDNDQNMDPTACLRETRTYVPPEKAKQPQYYQNYDDGPQHEISPF